MSGGGEVAAPADAAPGGDPPMRLLALVLLLFALHVPPAQAQSSFEAVDSFEEDGAFSLIIVPHSWNGAFIVYAHGYDADYRDIKPYPSDLTPANIGSKLTGPGPLSQTPPGTGSRPRTHH